MSVCGKKKEDEHPKPESPPLGKSPMEQLKERVLIGPSISIKGELSGEEDLMIQGRVEGKIDLKKNNITVGKSGRIKGDIYGNVISIEGEVRGNLFWGRKDCTSAIRESSWRYEGTGDQPRGGCEV